MLVTGTFVHLLVTLLTLYCGHFDSGSEQSQRDPADIATIKFMSHFAGE